MSSIESLNPFNQLAPVKLVAASAQSGTYFNGPLNNGIGATFTYSPGVLTIDGSTVNFGESILFASQSDATQNGIYQCTVAGTANSMAVLRRRGDFQCVEQIKGGQYISVQQGTIYGGSLWSVVNPAPQVIGQSSSVNANNITITQVGGSSAVATIKVTKFNSSGSYTPAVGLIGSMIYAQANGGAAGGCPGGSATTAAGGSGGGGGEYRYGYFPSATIGTSPITITIPAAATGVANANGNNGGNVVVTGLITANGGGGGFVGTALTTSSFNAGGGAGGNGGSGGDVSIPGSPGANSFIFPGIYAGGGNGGNSGCGAAGAFQTPLASPATAEPGISAGANTGAGGAGSATNTVTGGTTSAGGSGGTGFVYIVEYILA